MAIYTRERIVLCENTIIEIEHYKIRIIRLISEQGSTGVVYEGQIEEQNGECLTTPTLIILKEFYPISEQAKFAFERQKTNVLRLKGARDSEEYLNKHFQFELGFKRQREFSFGNDGRLMYTTVKPFEKIFSLGDSFYVMTEANLARPLDKVTFETLNDKLMMINKIAERFEALHEDGWIMTDFKPENFLWIESEKSVRVVDMDSFINVNDLSDIKYLFMNEQYLSPRLKEYLERCRKDASYAKDIIVRRTYLSVKENIYNLAIYMKELLLGAPSYEGLLDNKKEIKEALENQYKSADNYSNNVSKQILNIFEKSAEFQYKVMSELIDDLKELGKRMQRALINSRKKAAKKNKMHIAYSILEQYPVFHYCDYHFEEENNVLEVTLFGKGEMRESLIKAVLSCVQMLHAQLILNLVSDDAREFWLKFSTEINPELQNTVNCCAEKTKDDKAVKQTYNKDIVCRPLANVRLYHDIEEIQTLNNKLNYVFLTDNDKKKNADYIEILTNKESKLTGDHYFFASFFDKIENKITSSDISSDISGGDVVSIALRKLRGEKTSGLEKQIKKLGFEVHKYYAKGNNPIIDEETLKMEYEEDYNVESSERSALHIIYKLMSVGIDLKEVGAKEAAVQFYNKILSSKNKSAKSLFDKLVALEHLSWEAYMVLSGYSNVGLGNEEAIQEYAFNEFLDEDQRLRTNDQRDKQNKRHPCIVSSQPGRGLYRENRSRFKGKQGNELDKLDQSSIYIYDQCLKKLGKKVGEINCYFDDFERLLEKKEDETLKELFELLRQEKNNCLSRKTLSALRWKESYDALKAYLQELAISDNQYQPLQKSLNDIKNRMKIAVELIDDHDFKLNDEDIVRALPRILLFDDKKITIIKPFTTTLENIFSSLMIEPLRLILVTNKCSSKEKIKKQYEKIMHSRGLNTEIIILDRGSLSKHKSYGGSSWVDCSNCDDFAFINQLKTAFSAKVFKVENRKIKTLDEKDRSIELYNRAIVMTVDEIFSFNHATIRKECQPLEKTLPLQYYSLWDLYRKLRSAKKWRIFIHTLQEIEEKNKIALTVSPSFKKSNKFECMIDKEKYENTNFGIIIKQLRKQELIEKIEQDDLDENLVLTIRAKHESVIEALEWMHKRMQSGSKHEFVLQADSYSGQQLIVDQTKSVHSVFIANEKDRETNDDRTKSQVFVDVMKLLDSNEKTKNKIIHGFKYEKKDNGIAVSFEYTTKAAKNILEKEGTLLETLIYFECKAKNIFDDIRMNVHFDWENGITNNEIDVVGVKNSKSYFISVKMSKPEKEHLYEIDFINHKFGNEGQSILVTSHPTSRHIKGQLNHADKEIWHRSKDSNIKYLGLSEIEKGGAERNVSDNSDRQLIIADHISRIVTD